jgi:hypothetical protein
MTTPNDLLTLALKDAGVVGIGQTPLAYDMNDAFTRLNYMMAQWQRKRWLIYHLVTYSINSTGAQTYTIGPAGNIVTPVRPDKIESAYFTQFSSNPLPVDYPLRLIDAREDYNNITLKTLTTFPEYLFYDSGWPLGVLYPWPIMQSGLYTLNVTVKEQLSQFTTLTQTINLPLEYLAALHYNMCVRLRAAYQMPADAALVALAKDALNVIRNANAQIPLLKLPKELARSGIYNIYSDMNY